MSDVPPTMGGMPGQPSEEQLRAALMEMRNSPLDAMAAQVLQILLEGVQIKLGRRDARLLLDATVKVFDHLRPHLDPNLSGQVEQAVAQLRLAQVEAEAEVNADPTPEPNDVAGGPAVTGDQALSAPGQSAPGAAASGPSRLWTPGT